MFWPESGVVVLMENCKNQKNSITNKISGAAESVMRKGINAARKILDGNPGTSNIDKVNTHADPEELRKSVDILDRKIKNSKIKCLGLEKALELQKHSNSSIINDSISNISKYVALEPDSVSQGVSHVNIYLSSNLLKHASIIDTPGLRDPDPQRSRIALDEVSKVDAWIYLLPGSEKQNKNIVEDWRDLREGAHNEAGLLILTKFDLTNDPNETYKIRKKDYESLGWDRRIEACSSKCAFPDDENNNFEDAFEEISPFIFISKKYGSRAREFKSRWYSFSEKVEQSLLSTTTPDSGQNIWVDR